MIGTKEILVGLNDSNSSRAALRWAANEARGAGLPLRAVHVVDWSIGIMAYGVPGKEGVIPEARVRPSYRRRIRRLFEEVDPETDWTLEFAQGEAGPILVRTARQASMLVIGGRTVDRPANDESGLVGRYCLNHLPCALVVIGEGGGRNRREVESAMPVRAYSG